jgi:hypothetical protein
MHFDSIQSSSIKANGLRSKTLYEYLNSPVPFQRLNNTDYTFDISGRQFTSQFIAFQDLPGGYSKDINGYEYIFIDEEGNQHDTGKGNAVEVFSTVFAILEDFCKKVKPNVISIHAEKSKEKIYDISLARIANTLNMNLKKETENGINYLLYNNNQQITEQKSKFNIREYIQQITEQNEDYYDRWESIRDLIPDGLIYPSDHAEDRAELRQVSKSIIETTIANAINYFKNKIEELHQDTEFTIITNIVDIGIEKTNKTYRKYIIYIVKTVHENLYKSTNPTNVTFTMPDAINKQREDNPRIANAQMLKARSNKYQPQKLKLDGIWYSYTLKNIEELAKNLPIDQVNANDYKKLAEDLIMKSREPEYSKRKKIENASYSTIIYIVRSNNNTQAVAACNPYSIIKALKVKGDKAYLKAKFISTDDMEKFNMANPGQRQITEKTSNNLFKLYLDKLESEKPGPKLPQLLTEKPTENDEVLFDNIKSLKEHFRKIESKHQPLSKDKIDKFEFYEIENPATELTFRHNNHELAEKYGCSLPLIELKFRQGIKIEMANNVDYKIARSTALTNLFENLDYYENYNVNK